MFYNILHVLIVIKVERAARLCLFKDWGFASDSGMEGEQDDSPLDLSHLTEEEESTILQVLQRDLELRRLDEGRVRSEVTVYSQFCPVINTNIQAGDALK